MQICLLSCCCDDCCFRCNMMPQRLLLLLLLNLSESLEQHLRYLKHSRPNDYKQEQRNHRFTCNTEQQQQQRKLRLAVEQHLRVLAVSVTATQSAASYLPRRETPSSFATAVDGLPPLRSFSSCCKLRIRALLGCLLF